MKYDLSLDALPLMAETDGGHVLASLSGPPIRWRVLGLPDQAEADIHRTTAAGAQKPFSIVRKRGAGPSEQWGVTYETKEDALNALSIDVNGH